MSPLIEISSQRTPIIFPSRRNSFLDVPTIAASDDTDTLDAGMTSPLFTKEREVNPLGGSVHRQVSHTSNTQQPASPYVMHEMSCGKLQHCVHDLHCNVKGSCGKLQRSECSDVEKSLLNGERERS